MNYGKKVIVLSQVGEGFALAGKRVSAILRIESDGGVTTLYLSAINFQSAPDGKYLLTVMDKKKKLYSFSLGKRPSSLTREFDFPRDITDGFAAGISLITEGIPVLVAFSDCDCFKIDKADFKKAVITKCLADSKSENKSEKVKSPTETVNAPESFSDALKKAYDDEAVATENFYLLDEELNEKLKMIESMQNVRNENVLRDSERQKEERKSKTDDSRDEIKIGDDDGENLDAPYYRTAKTRLDEIFLRFPEEPTLSRIIPESRWARVNYSSGKFYVVGLIKENGKEKYLCYGVPAKYSPKPPKELKGYCSFVPLSFFDMKGDGYWMMFQSAITGDCVKPN